MIDLEEYRKRAAELAVAAEAEMRAKGADLEQHAVIVAMAKAVTDKLRSELGPTRYAEFYKEMRNRFLENASIEELRHMAELHRAAGEERNALDAIFAADYRDWLAKQ
jgi:hypothetical protein